MARKKKNKHLGSDFDAFLDEEGILAEVEMVAAKRAVAILIIEMMEKEQLTRTALARRMNTSRSALNRLLDPSNTSVTLHTLGIAATALGKRLKIELVER